jgi:hypothetical protein
MKHFPKSKVERKWLPLDVYKRNKIAQAELDMGRITFLEKLDASDLMLTDWEQDFVGNFMQARSDWREQAWWTDGRREASDKMRMKYGVELGMQEIRKTKTNGGQIPEADPGCCMYLVQADGGSQSACNELATCQTRAGFRYCRSHQQIAAEACKRKGTSLVAQAIS